MSKRALRATLQVTKALADAQRIRILMLLATGELCVCQVVEVLGLAPSTVSKHLSILTAAELVEMRKEGRWAYYRLSASTTTAPARPAWEWIKAALKSDDQILADRRKLKAVMACDPEELCRRQRPRSERTT